MSAYEKAFAAGMVISGTGALICVVAWWWTGRRASTSEREAVADAPEPYVAPELWDACADRPPVLPGRPEAQWQADLERFWADYDTYRTELRLPGERAS